jgi:ribosome biogenesis protein ENP2
MHGFFIDIRLYNKIRSIVNPEAYSDWKKAKIKEKMDKKVESRITLQKTVQANSLEEPKVNKDLANKLLDKNISTDRRML